MAEYLTNLPTEICNEYGLSKVLMTRRETIHMKHVFKNLFITGNEDDLDVKLNMLNMNLFNYMQFATNRLRGIYKITRNFKPEEADFIVKDDMSSFFKTLTMFKELNPIIILDFDKTITNKNFHTAYNYMIENGYKIIINSANPVKETIINYLEKNGMKSDVEIYSNKGKQKKLLKLKSLAMLNTKRPIFYIDGEIEYLEFGCMLMMYTYEYTSSGKFVMRTIFKS